MKIHLQKGSYSIFTTGEEEI